MSAAGVLVVEQLVRRRRGLGLRQLDVAERMGVRQGTVAEFERRGGLDPRIGTLERYARAVESRLIWKVVGDETLPPRKD